MNNVRSTVRNAKKSRGLLAEDQPSALDRHGLGHHKDEPVFLDCRNHSESYPRIAGCRFNDYAVFFQNTPPFGIFYHRKTDTVLDAPARIRTLQLHPYTDALAE